VRTPAFQQSHPKVKAIARCAGVATFTRHSIAKIVFGKRWIPKDFKIGTGMLRARHIKRDTPGAIAKDGCNGPSQGFFGKSMQSMK